MIRKIVVYGDPVLRAKGSPVAKVDDRVRRLAEDMLETMYDANGVGLAAQQVGESVRLTVIDVSDAESRPSRMWIAGEEVEIGKNMPLILLNPEVELSRETELGVEGCLSFPEVTADIFRAQHVKVRAKDLAGKTIEFEAEGLLARAVQHENDHLNGVLFIDRISSAAKASLKNRLKALASGDRVAK